MSGRNRYNTRLLRAADANYNRAKEGLRTVEDVLRFVYADRRLTPEVKRLRHELTGIFHDRPLWRSMVAARDSVTDIGAAPDSLEMSRSSIEDLVYAGLGRTKESVRVLEELCKVVDPDTVARLKSLRYGVYTIEKKIVRALTR